MALPEKYEDWTPEAQESFQSLRQLARDLRQYIPVTDDLAHRVNQMCQLAQEKDTGDGAMFRLARLKLLNLIEKKTS